MAIGELADGLEIDLDKVPLKYQGLNGTEIAISESQERMAVVVRPDDVDAFVAECNKENIDAVVVATDNPSHHKCLCHICCKVVFWGDGLHIFIVCLVSYFFVCAV